MADDPAQRIRSDKAVPAAIVGGIAAFAILNIAFYFLSGNYFDAHHEIVGGAVVPSYSPAQQSHLRMVFALVSGGLVLGNFAVGLLPRLGSHAVAAVLGAFNLVSGIAVVSAHGSGALSATLLITGVLMPVLAWFSYHRSRAAWSFLTAMCGVLVLATLFGAPKIRNAYDVSLWTTMLLPGFYAIAAAALVRLGGDYVDRTSREAAADV
jgi:hypothetical protein